MLIVRTWLHLPDDSPPAVAGTSRASDYSFPCGRLLSYVLHNVLCDCVQVTTLCWSKRTTGWPRTCRRKWAASKMSAPLTPCLPSISTNTTYSHIHTHRCRVHSHPSLNQSIIYCVHLVLSLVGARSRVRKQGAQRYARWHGSLFFLLDTLTLHSSLFRHTYLLGRQFRSRWVATISTERCILCLNSRGHHRSLFSFLFSFPHFSFELPLNSGSSP